MLAAILAPASAAIPPDVSPGHWSYEAVRDLAEKGIVLGYPDGQFLGDRALTRYEMATIIQRILRQMDSMHAAPAVPSPAVSPAPTAQPPSGIAPADIEKVEKLVDEYKVELTVLGTDLKQVREEVAAIRGDMDTMKEDLDPIKAQVLDPEGALATVVGDVSKLNKIKLSGYVQARYEDKQDDTSSNFYVRRARLKAEGSFGKATKVVVQIDGGGSDKNSSVTLKDAFLEYFLHGIKDVQPKVTMGQFKWPFGYEVVQSSSEREAPERTDVIRALFPGERDKGFMVSGPSANRLKWNVGLFNGVGVDQKGTPWYSSNYNDNNQHKDIVANARYGISDTFDVGVSGYWGKAGPKGQLQDKTRYGADLQWYGISIPLSIKAEYIKGKEPTGAAATPVLTEPWGYYAQAAWTFSPVWTGVYKYDVFDSDNPSSATGRLTNHQVGLIRYLDDKTRIKFFYQWRNEKMGKLDNDTAVVEWITTF